MIGKAATPSHLARAASEPAIPWEFKGEALTLDAYLTRNPTTGLLIARGDTVHSAVRKKEAAGPGPRESTALWAAAVRELGGAR
jgi:hypothetical protein